MTKYTISAPNGKTYTIEGPPGASRDQVIAAIVRRDPSAAHSASDQDKSVLERIPVVGGALASAADLPLQFIEGLAGQGKTFTDAFGAGNFASEGMQLVSDFARSLTSAQSKGDSKEVANVMQAARGKGIWEEVKAAAHALTIAPLDTTANLLGSAVPFIAATLAAPETGGASLAPLALGAASGVGMLKGDIHDATYQRAKEAGASDEQAQAIADKAQAYGGENIDMIALGGVIGAVANATGMQKTLAQKLGKRVVADVAESAASKGLLRTGLKEAAIEGIPEGIQAGHEVLSQNLAQQRAGYDTDLTAGVAGQTAFEGLAAGVMGGVTGAKRAPNEEAGGEPANDLSVAIEAIRDNPTDETVEAIVNHLVNNRGLPEDKARAVAEGMRAHAEQERAAQGAPDVGAEEAPAPGIPTPPEEAYADDMAQMASMPVDEQGGPVPNWIMENAKSVVDVLRHRNPAVLQQVEDLHAADKTAGEIAQATGLTPDTVRAVRMGLGLPEQGRPGGGMATQVPGDAAQRAAFEEWRAQRTAPQVDPITDERMQVAAILEDDAAVSQFAEQRGMIEPEAIDALSTRLAQLESAEASRAAVTPAHDNMDAYPALTEDDYEYDEDPGLRYARPKKPTNQIGFDFNAEPAPVQESEKVEPKPRNEADTQLIEAEQPPHEIEQDINEQLALLDDLAEQKKGSSPEALVARRKVARDRNRLAAKQQMYLTPQKEATPEQIAAAAKKRAEHEAEFETARTQRLQELQDYIHNAHPNNEVYTVAYTPERTSPYRVLGPDGETVVAAKHYQDFLDQVDELQPYQPQPEGPGKEPILTPANQATQELVDHIDWAREKGLIDNHERSQLLAMMQRPESTRMDQNRRPNDPIIRAEHAYKQAMTRLQRAGTEERKTLTRDLALMSDNLRQDYERRVGSKVRAALFRMAEQRVAEVKDARADRNKAILQRKLLEQEARGAARTATQLDTSEGKAAAQEVATARTRATTEPKRMEREARISEQEAKAPKYKRGAAPGGMQMADVKEAVQRITNGWTSKVDVNVVQSLDDLPPNLLKAVKADKAEDAYGFVAPDGTVHIIADNLDTPARATAILYHEALGHIGLETVFRKGLDDALTSLYKGNGKLKADVDAWMAENPDAYPKDANPLARAVEEVLAERSETGPEKVSLLRKLVTLVRSFARQIGFPVEVSDADVRAILAMAHDQIINGTKTSTVVKGIRYAFGRKPNRTTRATADHLTEKGDAASEALLKTNLSESTYDMAEGLKGLNASHSAADYLAALKENYDGLKPATLERMLGFLPTSAIIDWQGKNISQLKEMAQTTAKMQAMKQDLLKASDKTARKMDKFLRKFGENGNRAFARMMSIARIGEVQPDMHDTLDVALAKNDALVGIGNLLLKASANKTVAQDAIDTIKAEGAAHRSQSAKATQAKNALRSQIANKADADRRIEQLEAHTANVRDVMEAWEALRGYAGGHALYKELRSYYKDMFDAELALLDMRIDNFPDATAKKHLREVRADMMRNAGNPTPDQRASDVFHDLPSAWFPKDYFPFMRDGKYWLRVKQKVVGKQVVRQGQFAAFNSAAERDRALKALAAKYGTHAEDAKLFSKGNNIAELQQSFNTDDAMMQSLFDKLNAIKSSATYGSKDIQGLIDDVYQTWLMTSPERAIRRRFIHSKEVVGFQQNPLLQFQQQAVAYANQLSKLAYASDLTNLVSGAMELLEKDNSRPVSERAKLATFIHEMGQRVDQELNPKEQNNAINILNRVSYMYYLTSAGTAVANMLSIPIRVIPRLGSHFGYGRGTKLWTKYMKVWSSVGMPHLGEFEDGITHALMPSVGGSRMVKGNPLLMKAFKEGESRNILQTVSTAMIDSERATPHKTKGVMGKLATGATRVANAMGYMFNATENVSRQITYLMAFELQHEKLMAEQKPKDDAGRQAVFDAAVEYAVDTVSDTLGDYSSFERPRVLKGDLARALTLFKMFSITQTRWMVTSALKLVKGDRATKVAIAKELSGVMMMAGMFGGLMGLPLYTIITHSLAAALGNDGDDDDDVRDMMHKDPRIARDPDLMFRKWLNDHFGAPQIRGIDGRMHRLTDVLVHGPVSELTDMNIGSRTSLDLVNLWMRDTIKADTGWGTFANFIASNVAGFSVVAGVLNAKGDFDEGNYNRGLQKMLPAFFRTWLQTAEMESAGYRTRKGDTVMSPEEFNELNKIASMLGLRPTRLGTIQDIAVTRSKNDKAIRTERASLMQKFDRMAKEGATREELQDFVQTDIRNFNRKYPVEDFLITPKVLASSLNTSLKADNMQYRGMKFTKKGAARDADYMRNILPVD